MRSRFLSSLAAISLAACGTSADDGPTPFDDEHDPSPGDINAEAPPNDSIPDDTKADAVFPATFLLTEQSPVKSQGSRGVCSIFASTAAVEELYIKAGMPVEEADFSEQYLQWSTKVQAGAYTRTSGSTSSVNLDAVVEYGTVKEAVWPYESAQWNTFNDAACTDGENLPTRCYTNGNPPAAAEQAQKFFLPDSRYLNVASMKQHMTATRTGVNVGFTFFYQAWNHRRSVLPISNDYWRRGIITYPNAKDKEESLKSRAGHAIHIVGWDDNLEVCARDAAGKDIPGPSGCVKEKGFWVIKNSWGRAGFGIDHPAGAGYGYMSYRYVREYGSGVVAEMPRLDVREVCDDATTKDEDGDGEANCDDTQCSEHPACSGAGATHTFTAAPALAIPDASTAGVTSTIDVAVDGTVADVKLTVDITHTFRGDLEVSLVKDGTTVVVFDRSGGSADDVKQTFAVTGLTGKALRGAWTLRVEDAARIDLGTLNTWSLEIATH